MKKDINTNNFKKKDRRILIENSKKSYKEFLMEVEGGPSSIEKAKSNPDFPIYMIGIVQKGDAPNRNGRVYPFSILKKECDRYMNEEIKDGQSYGELDHPESSTVPELKNASHTIEDLWYKGTEVWARVKILNAFMPEVAPGKIARGIILNEKTLGISSRALGSVYQDQTGYDIVEDDLEIICWDLVSRPSTYNANLRLAESKKTRQQGQLVLTESSCFGGQCSCKSTKDIIKERKVQSLTEAEKVYVNILGVEKFLQEKYKK